MDNIGNQVLDADAEEMLRSFVSEAFDSLDTNEPIVELLREEGNSEHVNAIFRVFHTIKGLSGFYEMTVINKVTHEAETLLDIIRKQEKPQSEDTITVVYQVFDFLRDLLQKVSTEHTDKSGAAASEDMIAVIRDMIEQVQKNGEAPVAEIPATPAPVPAPPVAPAPAPVAEAAPQSEEDIDMSAFISDDMMNQYLAGAADLLEIIDKNLMKLEKEPDNAAMVGETFGAVHSLKGNSGFMGFSEIEEISMEVETILDCVRNKSLDLDANIITILLSNTEMIRARLDGIENGEKNVDGNKNTSSAAPSAPPVINLDTPPAAAPAPVATPAPAVPVTPAVAPAPVATPAPAVPVASAAAPASASKTPQSMQVQQKKDIRVDTAKIDKLFALVGELITAESMVVNSPDLKELELPMFNKSANQLNKISRELQEISMSIRMMPLDGTFNKMKRLVRDVSLKMNKHIDLVVFGEHIEMDKNVIDEISDPLIHILRNSVDHGVEDEATRVSRGKNPVGKVILGARYEGNEILISVEDDGNGINREAVLKKAEEKGMLKMAPEMISDREVFSMIFDPGFSTAKKVTDISGRGVGMDVVKKNIEKLRGSVDVASAYGKGTKITFRIPLTLAIMESMVTRVANCYYALPILSLRESFRPRKEMINMTMDGLEVVKIRNEILTVIRLHEVFGVQDSLVNLEDGILLVIEAKGRKVCIFVDDIVGQQQAVVKGLSSYIGKVPGITGCMVMSDSSIGLILDIEGLIDMAQIGIVL